MALNWVPTTRRILCMFKRRDHNRRRASYWARLGEPPFVPGDRLGAREFVQRIERELDDRRQLNETDIRRLRRMLGVWTRRAQGLDIRYMTHGTRPGRPHKPSFPAIIEEPHAHTPQSRKSSI